MNTTILCHTNEGLGQLINKMSDTPRTDKAEAEAKTNNEMSREAGDPPYNGYAMADFARTLERELNELRTAFKHAHVNNGKNDACKTCGLDLRHEIHLRWGEER